MKISILRTLAALSLGAAVGSVSLMAQSQAPIHVTVPFDFTVGSRSFTAGEYLVGRQGPNVLTILGARGTSETAITAHPGEVSQTPGVATLTFNKYGQRYFLSQVSDNTRGWKLAKSAAEKEAIAKTAPDKPVVLVAGQ